LLTFAVRYSGEACYNEGAIDFIIRKDRGIMGTSSENIIGSSVGGRYLVKEEVGSGGFGRVYKAHDLSAHNRHVIIKILPKDLFQNELSVEKFQQEIQAVAHLSHPNLMSILGYGQVNDQAYIVMQYIEGKTLRSMISPGGIALGRGAQIIRQVANALAYAHSHGIIHRDIKPENILLQTGDSDEVRVQIIDFGIAKATTPSETTVGMITGTPLYMPPEQFTGRASPAVDIYALGVVAYELLTGHHPFNPQSLEHLLETKRTGAIVKPRDLRPDLPGAAQELILRALSFDPEQRPISAEVFGEELYRALTNVQAASPTALETINSVINKKLLTENFVAFSVLFSSVAGATLLISQLIYSFMDKIFVGTGSSVLRIIYGLISITFGCIIGFFASAKALTQK
jgi:serine/threonine protein kinase